MSPKPKQEEHMIWIATLIEPDGTTPRGFVTTADALHVAVVCRRVDGDWLPEFVLQRDPELDATAPEGEVGFRRRELPSCFALDPGAAQALEDVATEETA
jgi:hypothetical protein